MTNGRQSSLRSSYGYVLIAALGFSFILVFSTWLRNLGMSSLEQLFFRIAIAFVVLSIVLLGRRNLCLTRRDNISFFATLGLTYALFAFCGLSAIAFKVPIAVSVSLIYTQPIYTALISHFKKKERITLAKTCSILVGVFGVFLVSGIDIANFNINFGIVFSMFGGILYAVYLWLKRRANIVEYTPSQILFNTFLFAIPSILVLGALLLVCTYLANVTIEPLFIGLTAPTPLQIFLLFLFAVFSTLLPYGALNYVKTNEVSPTTEGITLQIDPLLHMVWAMIFFQQYVSFIQYFGAFLILVSSSLILVTASGTSNRK